MGVVADLRSKWVEGMGIISMAAYSWHLGMLNYYRPAVWPIPRKLCPFCGFNVDPLSMEPIPQCSCVFDTLRELYHLVDFEGNLWLYEDVLTQGASGSDGNIPTHWMAW